MTEQETLKLKEIKNIEDELGIDLITFFKVYNSNHVFIKGKDYMWKINRFNKHSISVGVNHKKTLYFKDYSKTWSLNKEDLQ